MSTPTLFKGNSLVSSDMFEKLAKITKNLTGGGSGGMPRISLKGGKFRKVVNGNQVEVSRDPSMNIVIVNAAAVSRMYYEGAYDPENPSHPVCWSEDTNYPAKAVTEENKQCSNCAECPMNVKGSGQGNTRACRFSQRLAVVIENDWNTVYQLSLSSLSIFGDGDNGMLPLQAYIRFLESHNTPFIAVVTEMAFDEDADVPKVWFKAIRPLEEDELVKAVDLCESDAAKKAITLTVAQADGISAPKAVPAPKTKPATTIPTVEVEEEEEPEAPKKVVKKTTPKPEPVQADVSSVLDEWDD